MKNSTLRLVAQLFGMAMLVLAFTGTASALVVDGPGGCDYSASDQNGGWGWDPITRESCPPEASNGPNTPFTPRDVVSCQFVPNSFGGGTVACFLNGSQVSSAFDGCDYSAASRNHGWGWNPDTGQSCRPL